MKTVFVLKLVGYKYSEYEGNTSSKPKYCKLRLEIGNINNDPAPLKPLQTNLLKTIKCFEVFTNDFRFVLLCIYNVYTFVLSKDKKQRRTNNFFDVLLPFILVFAANIMCFHSSPCLFFTFWLLSFFLPFFFFFLFLFQMWIAFFFRGFFLFKQWSTHIKYAKARIRWMR